MKINMVKQPGGALLPANDMEAGRLTRFKTGEQYEIEIKLTRNPSFHRKMFAFLNWCFEHWSGGIDEQYKNELAQFEVFRKQLTILAGYKIPVVNLRNHNVSYEAESLSFGSMDAETFEQCYNAMTQAAIDNIFKNASEDTINQLYNFF